MIKRSQSKSTMNQILEWIEKKILSLKNERIRDMAISLITLIQEHPYMSVFGIIVAISCLGPLALFLGFLFIANACLLSGAVIIEVLILSAGLSVLLPVLTFSVFIAMFISCMVLLLRVVFLNFIQHDWKQKQMRPEQMKRKQEKEKRYIDTKKATTCLDTQESKGTQTVKSTEEKCHHTYQKEEIVSEVGSEHIIDAENK